MPLAETRSTPELVKEALKDARLLVRTEVLHAREEVKDDLRRASAGAAWFGGGLFLALVGLNALADGLAAALPLSRPWAYLAVGLLLVGLAAGALWNGRKKLPSAPLEHTQRRLKKDGLLLRARVE